MSLVFIGMSLIALLSASMLAIDVGMLMTARSQAQNSADAGALAGATALVYDDYDDRTDTGPSMTNAVNAATANNVMGQDVSVRTSDVEFLDDELGEPNRVKVTVRRSAGRGNAVPTIIAAILKTLETADITATATAEASPANAMTCVMPFTIPDRWIEKQDPPWDPTDTFDIVDDKGKPLANPDVYIPTSSPSYSGYDAKRDKGMLVTLKSDNDSKINPSIYYPWAIPGNSGASDYERDIGGCNQTIVGFDTVLQPEPGNMVGPTKQGMEDLIAKDPTAYWDEIDNKVVSNKHPSPRVVAIPLFDPDFYENGKHGGRNASFKAVNYLGFFIEEMRGNEVFGRVTPIGGLRRGAGFGPAPPAAFPKVIRLVK